MMISTQHLLPSAIPIPTVVPELPPVAQIEAAGVGEPSTNGVAPEPVPMDPAADPAPGALTARRLILPLIASFC